MKLITIERADGSSSGALPRRWVARGFILATILLGSYFRLRELGRKALAMEEWKRFLALNPTGWRKEKAHQHLKALER